MSVGVKTKRVEKEYLKLIESIGSEFEILLNAEKKDLEGIVSSEIAEGIIRAREGKVNIVPGYDGVFGKVKIFSKKENKNLLKQETLF